MSGSILAALLKVLVFPRNPIPMLSHILLKIIFAQVSVDRFLHGKRIMTIQIRRKWLVCLVEMNILKIDVVLANKMKENTVEFEIMPFKHFFSAI